MEIVLGSGPAVGSTSSVPNRDYVIGRVGVGRHLVEGSEVKLEQESGSSLVSASLPMGSFRGVADDNYWLLIEDESGCRIVPAPFVSLKPSGPEGEFDITEIENRIMKRRRTFNDEEKRARRRRQVEGRNAMLPWDIEPPGSGSDSEVDGAAAVKALRKGDDGWDARDDEANVFVDDDVSVQEWSDKEDEPKVPQKDADIDQMDFATAEGEVDALDENGHEIERLLSDSGCVSDIANGSSDKGAPSKTPSTKPSSSKTSRTRVSETSAPRRARRKKEVPIVPVGSINGSVAPAPAKRRKGRTKEGNPTPTRAKSRLPQNRVDDVRMYDEEMRIYDRVQPEDDLYGLMD